MKFLNMIFKKAFLGALISCLLVGCVSHQKIQKEIEDIGYSAFTDWKIQQQFADSANDSLKIQTPNDRTLEPVLRGNLRISDAIKLALQYNRQLQF